MDESLRLKPIALEMGQSEERKSDTVYLNVSGKVFRIMREPTLSLYPDSLLSILAEESNGSEPILVEANPDLFRYVLEYLRHKEIYLPITECKQAVLRECSALGLPTVAEEIVQDLPLGQLVSVAGIALQCRLDSLSRTYGPTRPPY